jgi:pimeloyl-ACP methyl ester carboxylesterase
VIAVLAAVLAGAIQLQSCELQGQQAECGTVRVAENRAKRSGRGIDLNLALIRHKAGKRNDDAIFFLAGGPGQAATGLADYVFRLLAGAERDIVLVDVRGTGRSNPLHCEFGGSDDDPQGYFDDFLPIDRVRVCRDALMARADLTQYTTRAIVADLDEVRRRLGYRRIDLYGSSYGTRVAEEFMRRHPKRVRVAILEGVVSPSQVAYASFARDAQRSLESVFGLCAADTACHAAYPDLAADYEAMLRRVANGIELAIDDPKTRKRVHVKIDRGLFGEILRNFLYTLETVARVPHVVHRAARGDFQPFGAMALDYARSIRALDFGLFLSVSCTEEISRLDPVAAEEAAAGTLLGGYRVEQQVAACRIWPHGPADPRATAPLRSSIPTLLLSGELDPVTPAKYAQDVAQTLSRVVRVTVPKGSHGPDDTGCLGSIAAAAVKAGAVRSLDLACVRTIPGPSFFVKEDVPAKPVQAGPGSGFQGRERHAWASAPSTAARTSS